MTKIISNLIDKQLKIQFRIKKLQFGMLFVLIR